MIRHSMTWLKHSTAATLLMLLLFGQSMTGCCHRPDLITDPSVVVVDSSEITENPDGTYTVSKGWMLRRLQHEQGLQAALLRCEQEGE